LAHAVRRLVWLACAERQYGRSGRANDAIHRALSTAGPEGYVRPFLEAGAQILPLLRGVLATERDPYLAQLVGQAERVAPVTGPNRPGAGLECLTDRERQVLGYLSTHLTTSQIAARFYISTNTTKSHIKAVYRKLGASSRDEAVATAVSLGLL
jgi:LuxR family maltose regulon positive regulatory protein